MRCHVHLETSRLDLSWSGDVGRTQAIWLGDPQDRYFVYGNIINRVLDGGHRKGTTVEGRPLLMQGGTPAISLPISCGFSRPDQASTSPASDLQVWGRFNSGLDPRHPSIRVGV